MTCIRARTRSNFGLIGPPTVELAALESLKKSRKAYNGRNHVTFSAVLNLILSYLQVMITYTRAWMGLKFG